MGYFDSIKENTALSAPEKKAAFNKQLDENKRNVYPNLILVMLSALGYTKGELAKRLGVSNAEISNKQSPAGLTTKNTNIWEKSRISEN